MLTYPRKINYACKIENTLSQILAVFTYLYSKNPGTSQTHDTLLNDFFVYLFNLIHDLSKVF